MTSDGGADEIAADRLRLALDAAELGTWHWSAVDGSNAWDEQMHRIYGLEPGTFDGSWDAWVASVHPEDRDEVIAIVLRAMEQRSSYVLRNRIVRPDGQPAWIEAHGKVLTDADDSPIGTIGCVLDVTERVQLERRVSDVVEDLQRSLAASPLPDTDRFELAASSRPGGDDLEQIGGDWYDAVESPAGELTLVIGDAMGRGVRAATTMIHVRAGVRGLLTVETRPAELLTLADRILVRDAPEQFVTAAVARLDPAAGTVELANAGHVPMVLVQPDGAAVLVGLGSGPPLGLARGETRASERRELVPGSTVVLLTDGVVESRSHDVEAGIEQVRRRAEEIADRPVGAMVEELAALADERLGDDVTVLVARLR